MVFIMGLERILGEDKGHSACGGGPRAMQFSHGDAQAICAVSNLASAVKHNCYMFYSYKSIFHEV
jgi:hypothetical protein